jgi:hypothetical protein
MKKMKNVIVLFLIFIPFFLLCQSKKDLLLENKISNTLSVSYEAIINLESNDTVYYFNLNLIKAGEWGPIIRFPDTLTISNKIDFENLFNDFASSYKTIIKKEKITMRWSNLGYIISVSENINSKVFFTYKFTFFSIKPDEIVSLLRSMKNIDFGSYNLAFKE